MNSRVMKVISTALLAYFVIMIATAVFGSMVDDGVILDAWYSMLKYIPFGNVLAPVCIDLFSDSFNMGNNLSEYLVGIKALTPLDFFEDIATLMLTAVFFEAVNNALQVIMGIKNRGGVYNVLIKMISGMVSALLCTFIASIVLHFLCQQLVLLPNIVQGIVSIIVTCITVAGAIGILYFVLGVGMVGALVFVLIKIVIINVLKVGATYTGILLVLLFLGEKAYLKMFSVISVWGVVIIVLIGIDIMISSIFNH